MANFFHAHAHSEFSSKDAIQTVPSMVAKAAKLHQPAVALTDHGNMSGSIQLYQAAKKYGVMPFPGVEAYLVEDIADKKAPRYHVGLLATTFRSYQRLIALISHSHQRDSFYRFPRIDFSDLASVSGDRGGNSIVLLTGCYFGLIQQTLVNQGYEEAKQLVEMYAGWFPNTFVEIQNHNIFHDSSQGITDIELCESLVEIADELGLPALVTQDTHYLSEYDKPAHDLMKKLVYRGSDENEFPGDSFHFASTEWVEQHHIRKHWRRSEDGYDALLGLHKLRMPLLESFRAQVPRMAPDADDTLEKRVWNRLDDLYGKVRGFKVYKDRLGYELNIIKQLKISDYFLHVLDFVQWCNKHHIAIEARGSSNASLVCYLLGITQVDPIKHKLTFERFLSLDRQKPPDIDIDIEDVRRGELLGYLHQKYGAISIGTYGSLGARDDNDRGSVLVAYNSYLRSKLGPAGFTARFGKDGVQTIEDVRGISKKDYVGIRQLSKLPARSSYGVHASGLLLNGTDVRIADYVPTMLVASSGTTVTQFVGDDLESLGFLKDDVLGQRTLTVMTNCQRLIGRSNPSDFSWIPYDDADACKAVREGRINTAIFQFEGYAMAKGARMLGVRSTNDCIIAGALFRPACMASGVTDMYLERRRNPRLMDDVDYPHPAFESVLKETYGCVLFQEQVLEIMRELGLDYAGINTFFKIVKDSGKGATGRNLERASEVKKQWNDICRRNGITDKDRAWKYIEGYTQYGFNKAHATGYGVRAYRAAYLKTHYPTEFMASVLESVAGKPKERDYIREARRIGVRLLDPDVNVSGVSWTMDPNRKNTVRKGLASIPGIGIKSALAIFAEYEANGSYESIEDMIARLPGRVITGGKEFMKSGRLSGNLEALRLAGALSSLGHYRDED